MVIATRSMLSSPTGLLVPVPQSLLIRGIGMALVLRLSVDLTPCPQAADCADNTNARDNNAPDHIRISHSSSPSCRTMKYRAMRAKHFNCCAMIVQYLDTLGWNPDKQKHAIQSAALFPIHVDQELCYEAISVHNAACAMRLRCPTFVVAITIRVSSWG